MGRAKLSMALINNEKARNTTFQKRKTGLLKKARELKILCGVQVCLIIYGPKIDNRQVVKAEIWPPGDEGREEVEELIDVYGKQPMEERKRRTSSVPKFFEDRNRKVKEATGKLRMKNNEAKYPTWDDGYNGLSEADLKVFSDMLENKIQEVKTRVDQFINGIGNPRLVAPPMTMMDCMDMESNPRLEASVMVAGMIMESNTIESSYSMPGLFRRRNMQLAVVNDQKMRSLEADLIPMHHQYQFDQQNHHTLQFNGASTSSNYVHDTTFDRQIYRDPWMVGMINSNMVVANSVPQQPPVARYYAPCMQYPGMASASSQILDEYYPFGTHELHDIKNQD